MKMTLRRISWYVGSFTVLLAVGVAAAGADRFVVKDHPGGDGNYLTWETAAPDIQSAIDAAVAGDTIWVTNGVYDSGGRVFASQSTTNRVVIDKAVTVRSVNGPEFTVIKGKWDLANSEHGYGPAAIRGVYMRAGSALIGITVTNGATGVAGNNHWNGRGAGIQTDGTGIVISNCVIVGNSANRSGGGISQAYTGTQSGTIYDSVIMNNRIENNDGAGVMLGADYTLYRCRIIGNTNTGSWGGGGRGGIYVDCFIAKNHTGAGGGGTYGATLYSCIVSNNTSGYIQGGAGIYSTTAFDSEITHNRTLADTSSNRVGGGANLSTLYNCVVAWNQGGQGGGAANSDLYNCLVVGNQSLISGGGTRNCELFNVTLVGNRYTSTHPSYSGGGVYDGVVVNSIVVGNYGLYESNYAGDVVFTNSLTYPEQAGWAEGNITNAPIFFEAGSGYGLDHVPGDYRLQSHSPGMNAGIEFDWMTEPQFEGDIRYLDLEGNPRIGKAGIVDMGAYEFVYVLGTIFMMR